MTNPASAYCIKIGGKIDIITKDDGSQYGMCVLPDGTQCEEWAYYRSECGNTVPFETSPNMSISPVEVSIGIASNYTSTVTVDTPAVLTPYNESVTVTVDTPTVLTPYNESVQTNTGDKPTILTPYTESIQANVVNAAIVKCVLDDSLNSELNSLLVMLKEAESKNDAESMKQIKLKITAVSEEFNKKLVACQSQLNIQTTTSTAGGETQTVEKPIAISTTTTSAASLICEVPAELQKEYDNAWLIYKTAIAKGDDQAAMDSKPAIVKVEAMIQEIKANCAGTIAPGDPVEEIIDNNGVGTTAMVNGECTVPVELTQEFEGQWKKYNTAIENNDTETAIATKAKIAEIEQKLSSTKGQCVKTIVSVKAETSDVVSYYKEKLTETLSTTGDVDTQIASLKQLRTEIDNTIADLIRKKSEFNASDATGLVDEIKVKKNEIVTGSVSIANPTASINTEVNRKEIKVKSTSTGASINDGNISVATSEATVSNNKLMVGSNEVKVAPSEVSGKTNMIVKQMTMATENGKAVYSAKGTEKRNLFAVLPVEIEKKVKVNAANGDIISEDKPWWSFLTTESK